MPNAAEPAVPRVSVIIPTYNSRHVLGMAVASVLNQDLREIEVWVVGDGCTDDSAAVVAEIRDPRLHWIGLPENSGTQSLPNNLALVHARADLIAYINHDDLWLPWHLSALVACIEATGAQLAHDCHARLGPQGVVNVVGPPTPGYDYGNHHVTPSCWLVRRALLETVSGWPDPAVLSCAVDDGLLRRIHALGASIVCLPRVNVLKFPSHLHRLYDPSGEPAQTVWWERIQADPVAAEHRLLTDLALILAVQQPPQPRVRDAVRQWLVDRARRLVAWYGPDRPPVPALQRWRWQRFWRRRRAKRGLPPRSAP